MNEIICDTCTKLRPISKFGLVSHGENGKKYHRHTCHYCRNSRYYGSKERAPASEVLKEERRVIINKRNKDWRENNKEKWSVINRLQQHKRRALGAINSTEWIAKVALLKNECQACFKTEPEVKITIDHITPVSKGGTNHIDNLQPLCMTCNQKKHTKIRFISPSLEYLTTY